ncbi:MAG: flagellar basal body rod protein FlgC [Lachnospiraceae bacterium]|nr:flagellar basal body rod protein FlgC [Lachnospiraceae bacterium]
MSIFNSFDINSSGMTAQRFRMDVIAENVANANTTRTADGTPYRRKVVTFEEKGHSEPFRHVLNKATNHYSGQGVRVGGVYEDTKTDLVRAYDPEHPDADEDGYVWYPNVSIITEMTNLIDASRAYEANATAFNASKSIASRGLEIGRSS